MAANSWYYSIRGQVMGPVTVEQLQKLVTSGLLDDGGKVREASSTSWLPPEQVPALQSLPRSQDSIRSATMDAVNRLNAKETSRQQKTSRQKSLQIPSAGGGLKALVMAPYGWAADALEYLVLAPLASVSPVVWKSLGVVAVFAAVITLGVRTVQGWSWRETAYATVDATWVEYSELRDAEVTDDVWDDFRTNAIPKLAESTEQILGHIDGASQSTRDLLRMSRDVLPALIQSAPDPRPSLDRQYVEFVSRYSREQQAPATTVFAGFGMTERLFLIFDCVVVAVAVGWYFMRR